MNLMPNGCIMYDNIEELQYAIFQEMNINILPDGCLFDTDTNSDISFQGQLLKVNTNIQDSRYATEGEVLLDPLNNIKQISTLFGYYLNKLSNLENINVISYYPTEVEVENSEYRKTYISIKFEDITKVLVSTKPYYNKCLSLIEAIFAINCDLIDLSNFDSVDFLVQKGINK